MSAGAGIFRKMLLQTAIWLAITATLLFVPAGTTDWPEAWIFMAEIGVLGLVSGFLISRHDPELLAERLKPPLQSDQKSWDKVVLSLFFALWLAQYVVIGLDRRFGASDVPVWLEVVGALAIALGIYMFHVVMRTNTFAAPVVKIQTERKHSVISTGPYALVRHPMYAGAIPLIIGTPLLLGSWWGVAWAPLLLIVLAYRAVREEETLKSELDGYAAYAARVRYRLVPGVW